MHIGCKLVTLARGFPAQILKLLGTTSIVVRGSEDAASGQPSFDPVEYNILTEKNQVLVRVIR